MRVTRRAPVLVVLAALFVTGAVLDRSEPRSARTPARPQMPTAAPAGALSSTWYCPVGVGPDGARLVLANAGAGPVHGRVLVVPTAGAAASTSVTVAGHSSGSLRLADVAPVPHAAVVDLDAGQVAAEVVVAGTQDFEASPCASAASTHWYFADGSTAKDATLQLSLFNPFPEDAIADLAFSTDQGRAVPAEFQGIVVPARSLSLIDVGSRVRRREAVATAVSVRTGRLVAAQVQTRTVAGRAGVSTTLGAPSLGQTWYFADGVGGSGLAERYSVANPNPSEARVLVEMDLDEGVAEPLERVVPANGRVEIVIDAGAGVPPSVGHATTVRSLNDVGVVVSRAMEAAPPASRTGRADTLGARRAARAWVFAVGSITASSDEWVLLANPGDAPARVRMSRLTGGREEAMEGLAGFTVDPGRRRAIRLRDHAQGADLPVIVRSTVPLVAERSLYNLGRPGLSAGFGIPLG